MHLKGMLNFFTARYFLSHALTCFSALSVPDAYLPLQNTHLLEVGEQLGAILSGQNELLIPYSSKSQNPGVANYCRKS